MQHQRRKLSEINLWCVGSSRKLLECNNTNNYHIIYKRTDDNMYVCKMAIRYKAILCSLHHTCFCDSRQVNVTCTTTKLCQINSYGRSQIRTSFGFHTHSFSKPTFLFFTLPKFRATSFIAVKYFNSWHPIFFIFFLFPIRHFSTFYLNFHIIYDILHSLSFLKFLTFFD